MEKKIVNNYGSFDIVFVKGKNATLWASDGKKYIDFMSGIGVNSLGHGDKALVTGNPYLKLLSFRCGKPLFVDAFGGDRI